MSGESRKRIPAVRSRYLLGIVVRCAALAAVVFAAFVLAMLITLDVEIEGGYRGMSASVDTAGGRLAAWIIPVAAASALLVGAGGAFIAVRASHKIAGPVFRLGADLRRMAQGDYDFVVGTRQADQLKDVAKELDDARSRIQRRLLLLGERARAVAEAAGTDEPAIEEIARRLASLEEAMAGEAVKQEGSA